MAQFLLFLFLSHAIYSLAAIVTPTPVAVLESNCFGYATTGVSGSFLVSLNLTQNAANYSLAIVKNYKPMDYTCVGTNVVPPVVSVASVFVSNNQSHWNPQVSDLPEAVATWSVLLIACPITSSSVSFTVIKSPSLNANPLTCGAVEHEHVSLVRLVLVVVFGGLVWLGLSYYVFRKILIHNKYFYFFTEIAAMLTNLTSFLPKRSPQVTHNGEVDEVAQFYDEVASFQSLPPNLSAIIGILSITVFTGIWVSAIMATLLIANWPSYIGIGMIAVLIFYLVVWYRMKRAQNQAAIDDSEQIDQEIFKKTILDDVEQTKIAASEHRSKKVREVNEDNSRIELETSGVEIVDVK